MKDKLQNKLKALAVKFRPKAGKTVHYIQPQQKNGRIEYQQPRKTN